MLCSLSTQTIKIQYYSNCIQSRGSNKPSLLSPDKDKDKLHVTELSPNKTPIGK